MGRVARPTRATRVCRASLRARKRGVVGSVLGVVFLCAAAAQLPELFHRLLQDLPKLPRIPGFGQEPKHLAVVDGAPAESRQAARDRIGVALAAHGEVLFLTQVHGAAVGEELGVRQRSAPVTASNARTSSVVAR